MCHALTHARLKYFPSFVITDVSDTQQCDLIEIVLTKQWQASPSDLLKTSHAYKYTIDLRSRAGAVMGIPSLQEKPEDCSSLKWFTSMYDGVLLTVLSFALFIFLTVNNHRSFDYLATTYFINVVT